MNRSRRMACVIAAVLAIIVATGAAAYAADNALKIGIINVQKVYDNAPRFKQYMEMLVKLQEELGSKLEIRSQNLMLPEEQIKEIVDLKIKQKPTEQDTARIKELSDIERANDAELKRLQGLKDLTEQDKAKLNELTEMQKKARIAGEEMEKDYNSRLHASRQDLENKASADLQEAVNKVAEEKGLTYVIAKDAMLFGGVDVTDNVISKLDRKAQ